MEEKGGVMEKRKNSNIVYLLFNTQYHLVIREMLKRKTS